MRFHRDLAFPVSLPVVLAVLVVGCTGREPQEPEPETGETDQEMAVEISDRVELSPEALDVLLLSYAVVNEQELSPSIEVPAEVVAVPDRRATVGPRVAGRVAEVRVNVGDQVRRGAVLAVLESEAVGRGWADLIAARARRGNETSAGDPRLGRGRCRRDEAARPKGDPTRRGGQNALAHRSREDLSQTARPLRPGGVDRRGSAAAKRISREIEQPVKAGR